ncbi:MAG TPA: hypothetical protein VII38_20925 [Polyangia bacterium]|jgi:hypothetical protein
MRRLAPLLYGCVIFALAAGCQPRSELVVGLITDLTVPSQIDLVTLEADQSDGVPVQQKEWPRDGTLALPGSFGLYTDNGQAPSLTVTVAGYLGATQVVARTAVIPIAAGKTLFVRLGLAAGCAGQTCPAGQSCADGKGCVDQSIDPATLPVYAPQLTATVACDSGPRWLDTTTSAPLPVGAGCPSGALCREGTCYPAP